MGWWQVTNINNGGIDLENIIKEKDAGKKRKNRITTEESHELILMGDTPADITGTALREIDKAYTKEWGRKAKKEEFIACFNFCIHGYLDYREQKNERKQEKSR